MGIVKKNELESIFDKLVTSSLKQHIDKYLFILKKLNLLKEVPYGKDRYYVACIDSGFIKYSYKDNAHAKDRMAWKILFRRWFSLNDARRVMALKRLGT